MGRALTIQNLYDINNKSFDFDGIWLDVLGKAETDGAWMVWGREKNGKSALALLLANYLSGFEKTLYISAEEGMGNNFIEACKRAKISASNKSLHFVAYISMADLYKRLTSRKGPRIVFIDNVTTWKPELKNGGFEKMLKDFPKVLFVCLAHEKNKKPYTSIAETLSILAKIKFYVEGLACEVSGRCPGGKVIINNEAAALYHGQQILNVIQ